MADFESDKVKLVSVGELEDDSTEVVVMTPGGSSSAPEETTHDSNEDQTEVPGEEQVDKDARYKRLREEDSLSVDDSQQESALLQSDGIELPSAPGPSRSGAKKEKESGIFGTSFNIINSIVGAGMIGIPAALREAGFVTGVILLVLVAAITDFTLYVMVSTGVSVGKFSYQEVMQKAFGKIGYILTSVTQFGFPAFAMAGYIVIVGDTITKIVEGIFGAYEMHPPEPLGDPAFIKFVCVLLIMLPLCLLRNVSSLEKFSAIAVLLIIILEVIVLYEIIVLFCPVRCYNFRISNASLLPPDPPCCESAFYTWGIDKEVFAAVGVLAFAYVCHHNIFLMYNALRNKTMRRFAITVHISVGSSMLFLGFLGTLGYLTFMTSTEGDLLNNYCISDPFAEVARGAYASVIMLTYPIECCVTREVLEIVLTKVPQAWISKIKNQKIRSALEAFLYKPVRQSLLRHIILTLLLVGGTAVVGIAATDLEVVLALAGSLTATPIAFIFPAAVYLKLTKEKGITVKKVIMIVIFIFGVVVMLLGTGLAIYRAVVNTRVDPPKLYCPEVRREELKVTSCPVDQFRSSIASSIDLYGCDCEAMFRRDLTFLNMTDCSLEI